MNSAVYSWLEPLIHPAPLDNHKPFDISQFKFVGNVVAKNLYFEDDPDPIAYFRTVENVNKIKQEVFNFKTSWVWFDEYLPMAWTKLRGVPNEGDAIRTIVDTIDHDTAHPKEKLGYPPLRTIMYGNFNSISSPLLKYFGVKPFQYGIYRVNRDVVVETVMPDMDKLNDLGGLSADVRQCYLATDENSYVRNIPKNSTPSMSIRIEKHFYVFYWSDVTRHTYIQSSKKHVGAHRYGTLEGLQENEIPLNMVFSEPWDTALRVRAVGCTDFYSDVYTKLEYLADIS